MRIKIDIMNLLKLIYAWSVHLLTSLGAVFGVLAIIFAIKAVESNIIGATDYYYLNLQLSIYSIIITIFIDSIDGSLARFVDIKKIAPFDGALLDNIIDFLTFAIVPCIWIYVANIVPESWVIPVIVMITIASSYQFCQPNAKTDDHFFVGFPSYWNIIVIYMLCFQTSQIANLTVLIILAISSFVPVKYIYLSRTDYISNKSIVKSMTFAFAILTAVCTVIAIMFYPQKTPTPIMFEVYAFMVFYVLFSLKLTIKPVGFKNN
jgi:phosphatidylcholine synthase